MLNVESSILVIFEGFCCYFRFLHRGVKGILPVAFFSFACTFFSVIVAFFSLIFVSFRLCYQYSLCFFFHNIVCFSSFLPAFSSVFVHFQRAHYSVKFYCLHCFPASCPQPSQSYNVCISMVYLWLVISVSLIVFVQNSPFIPLSVFHRLRSFELYISQLQLRRFAAVIVSAHLYCARKSPRHVTY